MNHDLELIVMLTHNDYTVKNAFEIFEQCKNAKAHYWGLKQVGLPFEEMKQLFCYMKECGKATVLEVVAYTEEECLQGAKMAVECGCDLLMGTLFFDSIHAYVKEHPIKYMPFIGTVKGHPSVLEGEIDTMVEQAQRYLQKGVYGFDLLGYRHAGDAALLNKTFVSQVNAPVCLAGSIDSYQKLAEVKGAAPWGFTVGGAFFEHKFAGTVREQIDAVCEYMQAQRGGEPDA